MPVERVLHLDHRECDSNSPLWKQNTIHNYYYYSTTIITATNTTMIIIFGILATSLNTEVKFSQECLRCTPAFE